MKPGYYNKLIIEVIKKQKKTINLKYFFWLIKMNFKANNPATWYLPGLELTGQILKNQTKFWLFLKEIR